MNRGAWWAAVYGVTQSRTQLKQLSSSSMEEEEHTQQSKVNGHTSKITILEEKIGVESSTDVIATGLYKKIEDEKSRAIANENELATNLTNNINSL
jgi:hypothetical protein